MYTDKSRICSRPESGFPQTVFSKERPSLLQNIKEKWIKLIHDLRAPVTRLWVPFRFPQPLGIQRCNDIRTSAEILHWRPLIDHLPYAPRGEIDIVLRLPNVPVEIRVGRAPYGDGTQLWIVRVRIVVSVSYDVLRRAQRDLGDSHRCIAPNESARRISENVENIVS